jgi:hypothetical protein
MLTWNLFFWVPVLVVAIPEPLASSMNGLQRFESTNSLICTNESSRLGITDIL